MQIVDLVSRAIWDLAAWFGELTINDTQEHTTSSETNSTSNAPSETLSCSLPECTDETLCSRVDSLDLTPSVPPLPPDVPQAPALVTPPRPPVLAPAPPAVASPVLGVRSPRPLRLPPHRAVQAARQAFLFR